MVIPALALVVLSTTYLLGLQIIRVVFGENSGLLSKDKTISIEMIPKLQFISELNYIEGEVVPTRWIHI